ncbi:hypothetical protein [Sagittula salina]|uniref:Uncharacterized protein n=1 Tax=Sagittula salina TaxID=2820268 RepID=A0A940MP85_9RHOB|nr:hypothetical protein [Sagittula salina]MBP0481632.1 hypothetical protein [Sagittula salina]
MRVLLALLSCLTLALPAQAEAGAWPRDKGAGFLAVATRLTWPQDITLWTSLSPTEDYQTLYIEYGLTDRLTLGLDVGRSVSGAGKTVAFLQMPLRDRDRGPKIAAQMGLGQISGETVLRPGLSLGWGLRNGWLALDGVAEIRATGAADTKLDITRGWNLPRNFMLILQLQTGLQQDDPAFARFAPSLVFPLRKRIKGEFGGAWGLAGDSSMGLKFGLWAEF